MFLKRTALAVACVFAAGCATTQSTRAPEPHFTQDRFTVSGDACGASQFAHLVGEPFAEMHRAVLPQDANVIERVRRRTLEYAPGRLNVVLDPAGRIVAIGCF